MSLVGRRALVVAGATLASGLVARKPLAAEAEGLAALEWRTPEGAVRRLSDYAGRGVVLNFWATWCVPCVAEMPALDAMAAAVQPGVVVLPLSSDRMGAPAVQRFYAEHHINHLPVLLDPMGAAMRAMRLRGIPTTLLVDRAGRERGRIEGGADWDSAKTVQMVRALAEG